MGEVRDGATELWARLRAAVVRVVAPGVVGRVAIVLGVSLLALTWLHQNAYFPAIGVALLSAGLIGIRVKAVPQPPASDNRIEILAHSAYWTVFAFSVLALSLSDGSRPLCYFLASAAAAGAIAVAITVHSHGRMTTLCLAEILALSLSVRLSAFLATPGVPGSDPWAHLEYISDFVRFGHIAVNDPEALYYLSFPAMHLNAAAVSLVGELSARAGLFIGASVPLLLSLLAAFCLARAIAGTRAGLLAALLLALFSFHLQWGIQVIAMSFGLALFTWFLYLLLTDRGASASRAGLIIVFMGAMILTHTITAFVALLVVVAVAAGQKLSTGTRSVPAGLIAIFALGVISYWHTAGYVEGRTFLDSIMAALRDSLADDAGLLARPEYSGTSASFLTQVALLAGFSGMYFWSILGLVLPVRGPLRHYRLPLLIALVAMNFIAFGFPMFGLRNVMPYRWFAFIAILLAPLAAYAVIFVVDSIPRPVLRALSVFLVVASLVFFSVVSPVADVDSPVFGESLSQPVAYTSAELQAGVFLQEHAFESDIVGDLQYASRILGTHFGIPARTADQDEVMSASGWVFVWREIMSSRPVQMPRIEMVPGPPFGLELDRTGSVVYANPDVKVYVHTRAQGGD